MDISEPDGSNWSLQQKFSFEFRNAKEKKAILAMKMIFWLFLALSCASQKHSVYLRTPKKKELRLMKEEKKKN